MVTHGTFVKTKYHNDLLSHTDKPLSFLGSGNFICKGNKQLRF